MTQIGKRVHECTHDPKLDRTTPINAGTRDAGTAQGQHRDSTGTAQGQRRDSAGTAQGHRRDSAGTAQGHRRDGGIFGRMVTFEMRSHSEEDQKKKNRRIHGTLHITV